MPDFSSTTWLYVALFAGVVGLIAIFVWGPTLLRGIDWQGEIDREQRRLDALRDLPRGEW